MTESGSGLSSMPKEAIKKTRTAGRATPGERAAVAELVEAARARGEDLVRVIKQARSALLLLR